MEDLKEFNAHMDALMVLSYMLWTRGDLEDEKMIRVRNLYFTFMRYSRNEYYNKYGDTTNIEWYVRNHLAGKGLSSISEYVNAADSLWNEIFYTFKRKYRDEVDYLQRVFHRYMACFNKEFPLTDADREYVRSFWSYAVMGNKEDTKREANASHEIRDLLGYFENNNKIFDIDDSLVRKQWVITIKKTDGIEITDDMKILFDEDLIEDAVEVAGEEHANTWILKNNVIPNFHIESVCQTAILQEMMTAIVNHNGNFENGANADMMEDLVQLSLAASVLAHGAVKHLKHYLTKANKFIRRTFVSDTYDLGDVGGLQSNAGQCEVNESLWRYRDAMIPSLHLHKAFVDHTVFSSMVKENANATSKSSWSISFESKVKYHRDFLRRVMIWPIEYTLRQELNIDQWLERRFTSFLWAKEDTTCEFYVEGLYSRYIDTDNLYEEYKSDMLRYLSVDSVRHVINEHYVTPDAETGSLNVLLNALIKY